MKAILIESKYEKCTYCGKEHHVLTYKNIIHNCPVPELWIRRGIKTFPTTSIYKHCSIENKDYVPADIMLHNLNVHRKDYINYMKQFNIKIEVKDLP